MTRFDTIEHRAVEKHGRDKLEETLALQEQCIRENMGSACSANADGVDAHAST